MTIPKGFRREELEEDFGPSMSSKGVKKRAKELESEGWHTRVEGRRIFAQRLVPEGIARLEKRP